MDQVDAVVRTQGELMAALWPLLEAGGMLVYATCSILKCENERQVGRFLDLYTDARVADPDVEWGVASSPGRQILPGMAQMDGFYYARLVKSA